MQAARSMSLNAELLQMLNTGNPDDDLLDFARLGALDWALEGAGALTAPHRIGCNCIWHVACMH